MKSALRYIMSVLLVWATTGIVWAEDFNPDNPPEPMVQYPVSISATPAEGTTSITLGGSFALGKQLTIKVTTASGYRFLYWTLNDTQYSTNTSFTYTVGDSAAVFVAHLAKNPTITVSVSPVGAGSVYGGGTYKPGTKRNIYTYKNTGYTFLYWTLNGEQYTEATGTSFYYTLGEDDVTFVAVYQKDGEDPEPDPDAPFTPDDPAEPEVYYRLDVQHDLPAGLSPKTIAPSTYYAPGKNVSLFATAPEGYVFLHWTLNDVLYSDQATCPYVMGDSDVVFTAHFATLRHITLTVNPSEAGTVSGDGYYAPNTKVLVSTTPRDGYVFRCWTKNGEVYTETLSFYYIVTTGDASFEAVYQKIGEQTEEPDPDEPFSPSNPPEPEADKTALVITVGVNDASLGVVQGLPTTPLFVGDKITLEAVSSNPEQYYFLHWTDGNTSNPREITLTVDARYTAVFGRKQYLVTFYDEDSVTVIDQREWGYGEIPTCINPAKPSDAEHSYRFVGWQPEIVAVTKDTAYYATYEEMPLDVPDIPEGLNEVQRDKVQCAKVIENGVLYLMYQGTKYNVQGKKIDD